jgi:exodeoxyribonuclease VII large subunit
MDLFPEFAAASSQPAAPPEPRVFSVSEITQVVRSLLEEELGQVWVKGEISNYRKQASGHQYFTLKDDGGQLQCVLFAPRGGNPWRKPVSPALADGMCVIARGMLTVYEARGQYQLNVQSVQLAGAGLLQQKFEALKAKLQAEGLFEAERKRALPAFPLTVAIVTSPTGAALSDMLNILTRRSPWVRVLISPVRVQGSGAASEIAAAVAELNRLPEHGLAAPDVIVVARGGGSVEDLWEFNEEAVVRALAASAIPTISAVGHEIDFTISDFAADLRAPTPSAAAELVAPDRAELHRRMEDRATRLRRCAEAELHRQQQGLRLLVQSGLFREPRLRLEEAAQRVDFAGEALRRALRDQLGAARERLSEAAGYLRQHRPDQLLALRRQRLEALLPRLEMATRTARLSLHQRLERSRTLLALLSPKAVLERGYALVFTPEGEIVRSVQLVRPGEPLRLRLADGEGRVIGSELKKQDA